MPEQARTPAASALQAAPYVLAAVGEAVRDGRSLEELRVLGVSINDPRERPGQQQQQQQKQPDQARSGEEAAARIAELEGELVAARRSQEAQQAEADGFNTRVARLEKENRALIQAYDEERENRQAMQHLQAQCRRPEDGSRLLDAGNSQLRDQVETLQKQAERQHRDENELPQEVTRLQAANRQLEERNEQLEDVNRSLQHKVKTLRSEVVVLQHEKDQTPNQQAMAQLQYENRLLEEKNEQLKNVNRRLQDQIETLQGQGEQQQPPQGDQEAQLVAENRRLEDRVTALEYEAALRKRTMEELRQALDETGRRDLVARVPARPTKDVIVGLLSQARAEARDADRDADRD